MAPIRAASVPPGKAKDQPIPPPAKVKKVPTCHREKPHQPPSKGSFKPKGDSAKGPAATSKVGQGHKEKEKSGQGTEPPAEGPGSPLLATRTATCTAVDTATCTATCTSVASATVPSGQLSEAAGDVLMCPSTGTDTFTTTSISATDTAATTATSLRRAQTVPPQLAWLSSPVGNRLRLQEASWTLQIVHEERLPALFLPAGGRRTRSRVECVSASMEYHATCSQAISWHTHPGEGMGHGTLHVKHSRHKAPSRTSGEKHPQPQSLAG
ncbi:hypothetical protein NDU88_007706 [Pleurodeles waltl]|uniref:Uncharacterized protein n=1 Tax=Pleurodeles waltl TaxID=8319 RepID=A0AAV7NUD4_PLEWA|nr:hypothetical protein NDU88_007706 [Pleurodeles waltl]